MVYALYLVSLNKGIPCNWKCQDKNPSEIIKKLLIPIHIFLRKPILNEAGVKNEEHESFNKILSSQFTG